MSSSSGQSSGGAAPTMRSLDERLARIEEELVAARREREKVVEGAQMGAATVGDILDAHASKLAARGVDVDERLRALVHFVELATRPEMVSLIETMAERAGDLSQALGQAAEVPNLLATLADSLDEKVTPLATRWSDPGSAAERRSLFTRARNLFRRPSEELGVFGLLGALRDPDVKRAMGLLMAVARELGGELKSRQAALPPASNRD